MTSKIYMIFHFNWFGWNFIFTFHITLIAVTLQGVRVTFHLFQKAITSSKIELEQKFLLVSANHGRPFRLR